MLARVIKRAFCAAEPMVLTETKGNVALVTLNRPKSLNALCDQIFAELIATLSDIDADDKHAAIVITGSGSKAFAAGADIKEMQEKQYPWTFTNSMLGEWDLVSGIRKPIIAAVNGYALGGGFELALMCDILYASENAQFGLPEITLGTIPGCGGTQRLIREVGKSKAMEMILTGKFIKAQEAFALGVVSGVFSQETLLEEALKTGEKIATFSRPIVSMSKDAINTAYETPLKQGIQHEKRVFWSTFATADQKEGMSAFTEKRKPVFKHK